MRGIHNHLLPVRTESWMIVTTKVKRVFRWRIEMTQWVSRFALHVVKKRILFTLRVGIGVAENPALVRENGEVAVLGDHIRAHDLDFGAAVFKQVNLGAVGGMPCPGQYVLGISPEEMGTIARVHQIEFRAVGIGREHPLPILPALLSLSPPAMKKNKTAPIWRNQQTVDPMF